MQIFNNWDVIAKGWYIACSSQEIPKKKAKSLELHSLSIRNSC